MAEIGPTRGDELTRGNARRTCLQGSDRIGNREDVLERRVPSGPVADEDDVVVRVDDAGNDGPAFEVHDRQTAAAPNNVVADRGNPAVADENLRHDLAGAVHRVDPPVDETEIACIVGRRLSFQPDGARPLRQPDGRGGAADELSDVKGLADSWPRHVF